MENTATTEGKKMTKTNERYHITINTHPVRVTPDGWSADTLDDACAMALRAARLWDDVRLYDGVTGAEVEYRERAESLARVEAMRNRQLAAG